MPVNVSLLVLRNYKFLDTYCKTICNTKRLRLLQKASCDELLAIIEIALNILAGNFPLRSHQIRELVPHAVPIRRMSRIRSEKQARQFIQSGKGVPLALAKLLSTVLLDLAGSLITDFVSKQN
jgi:hypothetical protein